MEDQALDQQEEKQEEAISTPSGEEEGQTKEIQSEEEKRNSLEAEYPELSKEQINKIIEKAIDDGLVVDYEKRFKPIYGALKQAERDLAAKPREEPGKVTGEIQTVVPKPKPSDFENYDDYVESLTDWKTAQIEAKREELDRKARSENAQRRWDEQVSSAMAKDPQFQEKGYIPKGLVPLLDGTDRLVDFAYYFGENPVEARRLMSLSPTQAAREIGKLEAKFATGPPQKTKTNAPDPTKPVGGKETVPQDPLKMSTEGYIRWRDKQEGLL